jgi:hypothetical protein
MHLADNGGGARLQHHAGTVCALNYVAAHGVGSIVERKHHVVNVI